MSSWCSASSLHTTWQCLSCCFFKIEWSNVRRFFPPQLLNVTSRVFVCVVVCVSTSVCMPCLYVHGVHLRSGDFLLSCQLQLQIYLYICSSPWWVNGRTSWWMSFCSLSLSFIVFSFILLLLVLLLALFVTFSHKQIVMYTKWRGNRQTGSIFWWQVK